MGREKTQWVQGGCNRFSRFISRMWRRGNRPAVFRALFDELHKQQGRLDEASSELEKQFLATSSELEELAVSGSTFVKRVETLVGLATQNGCDTSVFSSALQLVKRSTQFLVECREQTGRLLELLRKHNSQVESLLRVESELERTMLPLKIVQTLFRAQAAPLGADVQEMFGTLTREIAGLHEQVRDIFGTKFKQLEQTHQIIDSVISQLEDQLQVLERVTTAFKSDIETSVQTLEKELLSNQQREIRLQRLSKAVADEIGSIVIGLQFQDIVNQKLQHTMAALPRIESTFKELQITSSAARSRDALQFVDQSCRLEAGQLDAARAELEKAESSIQAGVQKVLSHLLENDSQCLTLKEFKLLTTSFEGIVQVLVDIITKVRELVEAAVASAERAFELLKPLRSFASDLTAVIRGMSAEIHLIGLNAQVQAALAARDPRGAALEVLSARTNEISHETNRISEGVAAALDTLAAGLAESVKSFEALRANGLEHQRLLNEQGRAEAAQLHAFRDNALSALVAIGTSLDEIRERAGHALAAVEFSNFHNVELPALRQPLLAIADTASGALRQQGYQKGDARLIEGFKRDYTMASEHEVHAKVISSADSATLPEPGAEEATRRVDLFTDRNGATVGAQSNPRARLEANALAPAACAPVRANELGSNVELF